MNDPHLENSVPSTWHLGHITYADGSYFIGALFPGIPLFLSFSSDRIAVGVTSLFVDSADVYEEKILDGKYLFNETYHPLSLRKEVIKVKNEPDREFIVESTRNGPLISKKAHIIHYINSNIQPIMISNGDFSLRWTGFENITPRVTTTDLTNVEINSGYSSMDDLFRASTAKTVFEFIDIMKTSVGVAQSVSVADVDGNIGFIAIGSHPKRKERIFGNTISKGWTDENDWVGFVQHHERPFVINPDKGFIVHANGPLSSENTEAPVAVYTPGTARVKRITSILESMVREKAGQIEYADMVSILKDKNDLYVKNKKKNLLKILKKYLKAHPKESTSEIRQTINLLNTWRNRFEIEYVEPTYFSVWEYYILKNILTDQFKDFDQKMKILSNPSSNQFLMRLYKFMLDDLEYKKEYCTSYEGGAVSSCPELFLKGLKSAIDYVKTLKEDERNWGSVHQAYYQNMPFSRTPFAPIFERSSKASGSDNTIAICQSKYFDFEKNQFR